MYFANSSEAFLGLISIVLTADQVGTEQERDYVFRQIRNLEPYRGMGSETFGLMLAQVNEQLFGTLEAFDKLMRIEGIAEFCRAFCSVYPETEICNAFQMACEIACADGLQNIEKGVLNTLGTGLGLKQEDIRHLLLRAEPHVV